MRAKIQDHYLVQLPTEVIEHLGDPGQIDLRLEQDGSVTIRPITEITVTDHDVRSLLEKRGISALEAVQTIAAYVALAKDVELESIGVSLKKGMRAIVGVHSGLYIPVVRGKVALDMEDLEVPRDVTVAVYPSALELINLPAKSSERDS